MHSDRREFEVNIYPTNKKTQKLKYREVKYFPLIK